MSFANAWGHRPAVIPEGCDEFVLPHCMMGVEVEMEFFGNHDSVIDDIRRLLYWSRVNEGSLRNGTEIVLGQPLMGKQLRDALVEMSEVLHNNRRVDFNFRTSVHVHMDIRDLSHEELHNLVVLYTIWERTFFRNLFPERENNAYCIPWYKRCPQRETIAAIKENMPSMFGETDRYLSLNLRAVRDRGSVEFRAHSGTADYQSLVDWINILMSLKARAIEETDEDYFYKVSNEGPEQVAYDLFGERLGSKFDTMHLHSDLIEGARTAQFLILPEMPVYPGPVEVSTVEKFI